MLAWALAALAVTLVPVSAAVAASAPSISFLNPTSGLPGGGNTVTINGSGFTGATAVAFGSVNAASFTVQGDSQITAVVPAGTAGVSVDVTVTTPSGVSVLTGEDLYSYAAVPVVTGVSPATGPAAGGGSVIITGSNLTPDDFQSNLTVAFGSAHATIVGYISANELIVQVPAGSPGVVDVVVSTVGGTSATTAADRYAYVGAPSVQVIGPNQGSSLGGTQVVIAGTGFTSDDAVKFGNVAATSVTFNNSTQLTATAPAGAAGTTVDVTVSNSQGVSQIVPGDEYTFISPPTVTGISPNTMGVSGGLMKVFGTGFNGQLRNLTVAGAAPLSSTVVSANEIDLDVGGQPVGTSGHVVVTTSAGASPQTSADILTYVAAPVITSFTPSHGPAAGGNTIVITGTGFTNTRSVSIFATTTFTVNSDTQITAIAPANIPGSPDFVRVTTPGGTGVSATSYTWDSPPPPPVISSFTPASGTTLGGTTVTLTGTGFSLVTGASFGPMAASYHVNSDTSMTVVSPPGAADQQVKILLLSPSGTATSSAFFTYFAPPSISLLVPSTGPAGTSVEIRGAGFVSVSAVKFGSTTVPFTQFGDTELVVTAPTGLTGVQDITITTPLGTSPITAADKFSFVLTPVVIRIDTSDGPASGGTSVEIDGAGFSSASGVKFGTKSASGTIVSDSEILATSPSGSGSVDVTVLNSHGASSTSPADVFTYDAAPTVTSVSPSTGPQAGGQTVTINGSGFVGVQQVMFGTQSVATVPGNGSPTQLVVTSPPGASGTVVDVVVTNLLGSSPVTSADHYTYSTIPTPVITGVSPAGGLIGGGTSVSITGSNFTGATAVNFGSASAASFTVNSATSITAVSPSGLGLVDISVTTQGGTSVATSADHYQFATIPAITVVSPSLGLTTGGNSVNVTGTGFLGVSSVKVGGVSAAFTVASDTAMAVTVPAASPGVVDITATTIVGTSPVTAADHYTYYTTPTITGVAPAIAPAGSTITVTGTSFINVVQVYFLNVGAASSFTVNSPTQMTVVTPLGAQGPTEVEVANNLGASALNPATDSFTFGLSVPAVSSVSPASGAPTGGASVVIKGSGFTGASAVKFGATAATFTVNNDTQITATAPAGQGVVDIVVTGANGQSPATAADRFTYSSGGSAPVVTAISPTAGSTLGDTTVVITGSGFTGATAVKFGGTGATNFTINSDTQITALSPTSNTTTGPVDVTVVNAAGVSTVVANDQFTYTGVPFLSSIAPGTGPAAGGTTVTITGGRFTGATGVKFGPNPATNFTVISDSQVTATSPAGAGTVDVTVITAGGPSSTLNQDRFVYIGATSAPTVTGVNPTGGSTAGGTSVVITGTNFTGATAVKFGGAVAASFMVNSATQVTAISPAGSGAVDVTVTAPGGTSAVTSADKYTYAVAPPTVTALSPSTGSTAGGTSVVITGTNFTGASAVKFGTTAATNFTVNSATQITATSPAGSASAVDVTVTTSAGTSATSAADQFIYATAAGPTVTALSPSTGPTSGGTSVVVTGTNFTGATAVKFGTVAATNFTVNSATQITATSPAGTAGVIDVTVTTSGGTSAPSAADQFTYAASATPTVTAVAPNTGPTSGGTSVVITGTNFTGATAVKFGATAATNFTVNSATQITATSPAESAGAVDVTITTSAGTSTTSAADKFTYAAPTAPSITGLSPTGGPPAGGTSVVISGSGFTGATAVKFGTKAASGFTVNSDGQITATSPSGTAGTVAVAVTTPLGTSASTVGDQFTYAAPPSVTHVSPATGPAAGGTAVTVTGTGFTGVTAVLFGATPAASYTVSNATTLIAVSPAGSGVVDITVANPGGVSAARTVDHFTYSGSPPPAPTVTTLNPNNGASTGGTSVVINGTNFTGATAVKFGAIAAATFTVNSATQITATTPAGSAGLVDVTVTTSGGVSATSSADQFNYTQAAPPIVTSIGPPNGPAAGGTTVTIGGSNFTGATSVKFGGVAGSFTVVNDSVIHVTSPAGSPGVVDITVTTPAGTSATSGADQYTYTSSSLPTVTGINPTSGFNTGGQRVVITGTNFTGANVVQFGSVSASNYSVDSATQITVVAPETDQNETVDVRVATSAGQSATSAADQFTYTSPQPSTITSVTPNTGPTTGGTAVVIHGTNLNYVNQLFFGATPVTGYAIVSATEIDATSPQNLNAGPVDVTVRGATGVSATSANDVFTYVFSGSPPTITGVSPTSGPVTGGTAVTLTGTGFNSVTSFKFGSVSGTEIDSRTDTQMTLRSPAGGAPGVVDITVANPAGSSAITTADHFTYTAAAPSIIQITPNSGTTAGGTLVSITGQGFTGVTAVKFGTTAASNFTFVNDSFVTVTAPAGSAGSVDITVTTPNGVSALVGADQFTYGAVFPPSLTSVSPSSGPAAGGNTVVITGDNLTGATSVKFGATVAPAFTVNSDTQVTATAPAGAGVVDVAVVNAAGTTPTGSSGGKYTYLASNVPAVTAIAPAAGPLSGGTSVVLTGSGFTGATAVSFGAKAAGSFTINSDSQITATSPLESAGTVNITVTGPGGVSPATTANAFTYEPTPVVSSVAPTTGPAAGGTNVVIQGSGLTGATAVKFGAAAATSFTISGDGQVNAVSPAGSGAVDITVISAGGASATSSADKFTYAAAGAPVVTGVSPASGATTGGTVVTVTGSGMTGATVVKFGTKAAASFTVNNDGQITATSPSGSGTVDITVTTGAGTSVVGAVDKFTYAAAPAVSRIAPTGGPATGGTSITITGTGFTGVTAVSFGATPAASFTLISSTSITAVSPPGSGVVDVIVTAAGGPSAARAIDHFTYTGSTPAPTVTGISPATGLPAGGTSVTISGTNFTGATAVKFGSAGATFTVVSASQITAISPAGAAGPVDVTVTTSSGVSATSAADVFTYLATPAVTQVTPNGGPTTGGTSVTITGTGFTGASAVKFGTASASFTLNSATQITATSPAGAAGAVDVTVATAAGTSATGAADLFTYSTSTQTPTITSLAPTTGPTTGGTSVVITGSAFTGVTSVAFGGTPATSFTVNSDTQVTAVSPVQTPGVVDVTIQNANGGSIPSASSKYTYVAAGAAPTVTGLNPTSGPFTGGTTVVITGTAFTGALSVTFSSTPAQSFVVNSDTQITAVSPGFSAATVDVTVTTPNGASAHTAADQFTFGPAVIPVVTAISPASGPVTGGTTVTITGTNFANPVAVYFGATMVNIASSTATTLTAVSPAGSGTVDITVKTTGGTSATTAADQFTYAASTFITQVTPGGGPTAGGTSVVIAGGGFTGATAVKFGTKAATSFTVNSDSQITAISPSAAGGAVDITVTSPTGTSPVVTADKFTYASAPTVTNIAPTSGSTSGGAIVTITGTNFANVTGVSFGGVAATGFTVVSATSITATSPAESPGTVDVTVSTFGGTSAAGAADHFTFSAASSAPVVTAISPASGATAGGTSVTITGAGFTGATAVKFGTKAATSFTVNSDGQVTAVSPSGTGTVDILVTTALGTSAAVSADKFSYAAAPAVARVNPATGPASGGTTVVITGSGFTGATAVNFGANAVASFVVNSASQITAVSPAGTGTVDVLITSPGGVSPVRAVDHFVYTAGSVVHAQPDVSAPTVTRVSPATGPAAGGTAVTITGVAFTGATSVTFGGVAAQSFTLQSATQILAVSPAGTGVVDVQVTTPGGVSAPRALDHFTYTGSGSSAPSVTAISPASGPTTGGTSVTISGANFTGVTAVKFGASNAASFTVNSATQITATSPSGAAGAVDITVTTSAGTSTTGAADQFTYMVQGASPTVTGLSPSGGDTTGGLSVTISGTNFTGATSVKFGSVVATFFTVNSATSITAVSPANSAGVVDVTVTTANGVSATGPSDFFTYTAPGTPPQVGNLNPNTGPTTGGTAINISGTAFSGTTAVKFGAVSVPFTILNDSVLQVTSPAGMGVVDITVTTPNGVSATSFSDKFTYVDPNAPPLVTAVSPNSGPSAGGTQVTITGTNLINIQAVKFGGVATSGYSPISATQIQVFSPVGQQGVVDVTITTNAGTSTTSVADQFTYNTPAPAPVVNTVSPSNGSVGQQVTITGSHLTGATFVSFGGVASSFTVNADTQILAFAPQPVDGGLNPVRVTVTTPAGTSQVSQNTVFGYSVTAPQSSISGVSPATGLTSGGNSVVITGANFTGVTSVRFGDNNATSFTVNSATQITATAPAGAPETVDISVTGPGGRSSTSNTDQYTYLTTLVPVITQVTPSGGTGSGGVTVQILGTGFTGATAVTFGGVAATNVHVVTDTQINAVAPAGSGVVDVKVTNPQGTSATTSADQFAYTATPTISQVNPGGGPAAGGTSVTITGTGFTDVTGVEFGTTAAQFTVNSTTNITAVAPVGVGSVDVRVITPGGVTAISSADQFAYSGAEPPVVTGLLPIPTTGSTAGGAQIVLVGVNFTNVTGVKFGSTPATSFTVQGVTRVVAVAPPGAAGPVDVTVTTTAGTSAVSAVDQFTYVTEPSPPTVTAISPATGAGGTVVTVTGTNFTNVQQVFVGGFNASFTVTNPTTLTVTTLTGQSGYADIQVQNDGGLSAITNADRFAYTAGGALPTVTSVSPTSGDVNGGYPITITGTNLSGAQIIYFGAQGRSGQITANSATSVTVTAISAGTAGAVDLQVVTANGVSATTSGDKFTYTARVPIVTAVSPASGPIEGANTVTITGSNFTGATGVTFGGVLASTFKVVSDTQITAVPFSASGPVDVTVISSDGGSAITPADVYTFVSSVTDPTIASITPNYGTESSPAPITINGTNFTNVQKVLFAGTQSGFTVNGPTSITVFPPGGQPGTFDFKVITAQGASATTASDRYTIYATPKVTFVTPGAGPTSGGGTVTLNGAGFTGATAVHFGAVSAAFTVNGDFAITATVPPGAAGAVDITVSNPAATSAIVYQDQYVYTTANSPAVSVVTPNHGVPDGGTLVTIIGAHFTGATQVLFGETPATHVAVVSDTEITANAPAESSFSGVDVRVVTPAGESPSASGDSFSYSDGQLQPQISALSPASGTPTGGNSVTITGANLSGAYFVGFGANPATSFVVNSATSITAVVPPGNLGPVGVVVTTAAGSSQVGLPTTYTYATGTAPPIVSGISPNAGPAAGGTVVAIEGANFTGATAVKFGGVTATSFTVVNANIISVVAPSSPSGPVDVQVVTTGGTSAVSSADVFTFAASTTSPIITSISPIHGPAAGGTSVVITGTNLTGATAVAFGTAPATSFVVNSDAQITAVSPAATAAVVNITVTTPAGVSVAQGQSAYAYDAGTTPTIFNVTPPSGPTVGGTQVAINGENLTNVTTVQFGSVAVAQVSHNSDTQLIVTSPPEAAGVVDIKLSGSSGASAISAADHFTYVATPTVTAIAPVTGSTAGGTKVVVTGAAFTGATAVKFGATAAASFTVDSDTQITAISPAEPAGLVDILVTTPVATSSSVTADRFTFAVSAPSITAAAPNTGTTAGGTSVVITGAFFTGATSVKFGTAAAENFTVNNDGQITAVAPAGAAGTVDIAVTTANGVSATVNADHYTYVTEAIPTVSAVNPSSGPANGGNTVTITGTGFSNDIKVMFGNTPWLGGSFTPTQITASVPPGALGTVDVTVVNAAGASPINNSDHYTYVSSVPTVIGVAPASGGLGGGYVLFISGTNFNTATGVMFGTTPAASFSIQGGGSIGAIAPPGAAGAVDITVITPSGTSAVSAADKFTFVAPTVTQVTPSTGPVTGGTQVTITGAGFTGATAVNFGSVLGSISNISDTQITVTAPAQAAGVVDVTVVTPQATSATGPNDKYTYGVFPVITSISPVQGVPAGGTSVTINGSGFTGATAVNFALTPAAGFTVNSDTQITAISPPGTGGAGITVTTPAGASLNQNQVNTFTWTTQPLAPVITSISSSSGSTAGGATVTVTGAHFIGAVGVGFGPTSVGGGLAGPTSYTINSDTSMTIVTPLAEPGVYDLVVANVSGASAKTAADVYTFVAPTTVPTVTAVTPITGSQSGETLITVSGTNFVPGHTTVYLVAAQNNVTSNVTVLSANSLTAITPAGAGKQSVVVQTDAGKSAVNAAVNFTYVNPKVPAISSVSPNTGLTSGGTRVTINGSGFDGATTVKFGTVVASFNFINDGQVIATAPAGAAGVVDISITTGQGTTVRSANDKFTYSTAEPAPQINSIAPKTGFVVGGTSVDIEGAYFSGATSVKFGGVPATSFFVGSDTEVVAVSPPGVAGAVDITVTTPSGTNTLTATDKFTYMTTGATPAVTAISPNTGPATGGTTVVFTGTGFTNAVLVKFGSAQASFSTQSDTQITAVAPVGATGAVDVIVTTDGGTSAAVAADKFTYTAASAPTVTSVSPASGSTAGGASVVIAGTNLTGASSVKFGTLTASFTVNSATQITAIAPGAPSTGTLDVTVTTSAGTSATGAQDHFTYILPPMITLVAPSSGATTGGTSVVITGAGLTGATAVKFGATAATSFTVNSDSQITAISPAEAAGTVDIAVTTAIGASAVTSLDQFTYQAATSPPSVSGVSPASGSTAGGATVTITGSGFTGATVVKFGVATATNFTVNSDTQITATSPAEPAGTVDVQVTTAGGTSAATSADHFTFQAAASPPAITSLSPTSGSAAGATSVTITGSGFTGATAVKFGATAATNFTVNSDTQATATSPAEAAGTVDVSITTAAGTSVASAADHFTFTAATAPSVSAIAPTAGATTGGTSVKITGAGFTGASAVKFGTKAAASFTVNSDGQVTAVSPAGTGVVDVVVTTSLGTSAVVSADKFTYTAAPAVARVNPATGSSAGGTSVTITGSAFTGATAVNFGAAPATSFTVVNATSITAVSPPGTGVVDVLVTTPGGTSAARAIDHFTYQTSGAVIHTLAAIHVRTKPDTAVNVDLSSTPARAEITEMTPAGAGDASILPGAAAGTQAVRFKPAPGFKGRVSVTYVLHAPNQESVVEMGVLTIDVDSTPDPSASPNVRSVIEAETDAAYRFGQAQISNFGQRMESLHQDGRGRNRNGMNVTQGFADSLPNPWDQQRRDVDRMDGDFTPSIPGVDTTQQDPLAAMRAARKAASGKPVAAASPMNDGQPSNVSVWTAGSIIFGDRNAMTGRQGFHLTSDGLSLGVDAKLSDWLTLGGGAGLGLSYSRIGDDGTKVDGHNYAGVLYADLRPGKGAFIDVIGGYGRLDFSSKRILGAGVAALGDRSGAEPFGSIAAGWDFKPADGLKLSPYGRFDVVSGTLNAFTETGAGVNNIRYDAQSFQSLKGTLGAKIEWTVQTHDAIWVPRARFEAHHEFQGSDAAQLNWATGGVDPDASIVADPMRRDSVTFGLGVDYKRDGREFSLDYELNTDAGQETINALRAKAAFKFW